MKPHNPSSATTGQHTSEPTIVIVGGVAGGASAATRARRINEHARVILFEKDEHVSFANCGLPYYIGGEIPRRDNLLVATPKMLHERFNLDVRTRHEVLSIDRQRHVVRVLNRDTNETFDQPYDKLILAPGAVPMIPPIDGLNGTRPRNVFILRNLEDTDAIKAWVDRQTSRRAVVVGAGFIGLEMVEQLAELGLAVTLVELQPQVLPLLDPEMAQPLAEQLQEHGVDLRLGDAVERFVLRDGLAVQAQLHSGQSLEADLFILGIGVRPNVKLAQEAGLSLGATGGIAVNQRMQTDDPDIYAVGDAAEYPVYLPTGQPLRVPLAGPANRAGRLAGEHAAGGSAALMPPVLGTSIVRLFSLTAGMTGLTAKLAARLGIEARSVIVVANHHVGYYPGAMPITLKLLYAPDSGKVLGAQAVGAEGVDKRLDVIATAMRFAATVRDLTELDLAYAPPFGAAKDPVHMAAFAASNELDGYVRFIAPDADLEAMQVVDVRSKAEVARAPLVDAPHAVAIPLDELRDRLGELNADRPTVVSCASGVRSYVAARVLMQRGFAEVYDLSGGATLRRRVRATQSLAPVAG